MSSRKRKRKRTQPPEGKPEVELSGKRRDLGAALTILAPAAFFAAFGYCVWVFVQPELIYHAFYRLITSAPPFQTDWNFFYESLTTIGGPLAYLYGFLSHSLYFGWAGTLILTVTAFLLWLVCRTLLAQAKVYDPPLLCYLCPIFLLAGAVSYYHTLLPALSVLIALSALAGYVWGAGEKRSKAVALFAAVFAAVFYAAGSAAIMFGLLAGFYELAVRRRLVLAAGFAAITVAVYFISTAYFELPIYFVLPIQRSEDIRQTVPLVLRLVIGGVYAMHLIGFAIIGYIALYQYFAARQASQKSAAGDKLAKASPSRFGVLRPVLTVAAALLPLALFPLTLHFCTDPLAKRELLSSYYCSRAEWQKVVELNSENGREQPYNVHLNHDLNRALYHTGQLGDKMFAYPQAVSSLTLGIKKPSGMAYPPTTLIRIVDIMMELGHLGSAEKKALELLESSKEWPLVVDKLAHIYLAKGQTETARVFLNKLSKDLIHGADARALLRLLDEDPELADYAPVQHLRSIANETDQPELVVSSGRFFEGLLQKNPRNKMAFEYMMAVYMLIGRTDKFLANIERMKDIGYKSLPRHYDEALAILAVNGMPPQAMHGYQPSRKATRDAARFREAYKRLNTQGTDEASRSAANEAIFNKLQQEFGDTFTFYAIFATKTQQ